MLLPNADLVVIPDEKLAGYCLNEDHPVGKDKAYLFKTLLGITAKDGDWLKRQIEEAVIIHEAQMTRADQYGQRYTVDFSITHQGYSVVIRTSWIILTNHNYPRLTSCYIC